MGKIVKRFNNGIQIAYFEFSKDIVCIEVHQHGKNMGQFCSDVSYFQEWDESDLLQLAKTHIKQVKSIGDNAVHNRMKIAHYELDYTTHYDELVCINVYSNDDLITAFCSDRDSFEEWIEEDLLFLNVIESQL